MAQDCGRSPAEAGSGHSAEPEPVLVSAVPASVLNADLEAAIRLATQCHAGQVDKAGQPYILHPLRVMLACSTTQQKIAAVLHDTVEDSGLEVEDVREMFGATIGDAVDALTKRRTETYTGFILRCAENELARYVKRRDLADNMDLGRLPGEPTVEDARRQQKYSEARNLLATIDRAHFAAAIEARRAETAGLGAEHESAVPQGAAQDPASSKDHPLQ